MRRIPALAFAIAIVAASSLAAVAQGWGPGNGPGRGMGPCAQPAYQKSGEACRLLEQSQRQRSTWSGPPKFHDGVHDQVTQGRSGLPS